MMSVLFVVFSIDFELDCFYVFMEMIEVMDGVIFGDVLVEELEFEVFYGVMILVELKGFFDKFMLGGVLGQIFGFVLMDVVYFDVLINVGVCCDEDYKFGNLIVVLSEFV